MLINHNINNLSGGVSRQPYESRYDNQVEEMINFIPTVAQGLRRRNPINTIGSISGLSNSFYPYVHSYDRGDGLEKYIVFVSSDGVKVIKPDGTNVTVNNSNLMFTEGYASSDNLYSAHKNFKLITVGDTTFILNKNKTVAMKTDLTPKLGTKNKAFYWLKRSFDNGSGNGYDYTLIINTVKFTNNSDSSETSAKSLSDAINLRYSNASNNPNVFPDYIRAVNIGSIVYVYVAKIYAPLFRLGNGTNYFVRVKDSSNNILGADVRDYNTSFNIITGKWKIYSNPISSGLDFYDLTTFTFVNGNTIAVYYYSNASQAVSNTSATIKTMNIYSTNESNDFDISYSDSWGDQASSLWRTKVKKISDLPNTMTGFDTNDVGTIEISGTDRNESNNYYVKWDGDVWVETVAENIEYIIDAKTMPYKLVRQSNGEFLLSSLSGDLVNRLVGDDESNSLPSFIGKKISNIFFHKNRLGFTAEENVILSETGGYFNFFATTTMEILDGDVIDVAVDSDTVTNIRNINSTAGALTLWSDKGQFILTGGDILSPSTVRVSQTSSYDSDSSLSPIAIDNEIIFFNKNGNALETNIFSPASVQDDKSNASSVSSHIADYVTSDIDSVTYSSASNMVFFLKRNTNTLYVYKYHIQNNERIMSSWFKFEFGFKIHLVVELNGDLYLFTHPDDSTVTYYMYKLALEPIDINSTFLDKGTDVYESSLIMSKYNIETKQNTKAIREPFYIKSIKANTLGKVDLDIINNERLKTKTINTKHLVRKLFIGGTNEKMDIGFSTSYDTGCQINAINLEGRIKTRSRNL